MISSLSLVPWQKPMLTPNLNPSMRAPGRCDSVTFGASPKKKAESTPKPWTFSLGEITSGTSKDFKITGTGSLDPDETAFVLKKLMARNRLAPNEMPHVIWKDAVDGAHTPERIFEDLKGHYLITTHTVQCKSLLNRGEALEVLLHENEHAVADTELRGRLAKHDRIKAYKTVSDAFHPYPETFYDFVTDQRVTPPKVSEETFNKLFTLFVAYITNPTIEKLNDLDFRTLKLPSVEAIIRSRPDFPMPLEDPRLSPEELRQAFHYFYARQQVDQTCRKALRQELPFPVSQATQAHLKDTKDPVAQLQIELEQALCRLGMATQPQRKRLFYLFSPIEVRCAEAERSLRAPFFEQLKADCQRFKIPIPEALGTPLEQEVNNRHRILDLLKQGNALLKQTFQTWRPLPVETLEALQDNIHNITKTDRHLLPELWLYYSTPGNKRALLRRDLGFSSHALESEKERLEFNLNNWLYANANLKALRQLTDPAQPLLKLMPLARVIDMKRILEIQKFLDRVPTLEQGFDLIDQISQAANKGWLKGWGQALGRLWPFSKS